jgi:hypothetical protein
MRKAYEHVYVYELGAYEDDEDSSSLSHRQ